MMNTYAIQAGALRTNPNSGPDGVGVQADIAYTLEARAEVQAVCTTGAPQPANDNLPIAAIAGNGQSLTFLSVCSGIEAASVAWHPLGWSAVAFSEIEKFPSAILAHHYPTVPNLGDFTKIDVRTLGRVDILAGGTPCQAFSVAGLRQSLADERGNLSLEFVRLAHELATSNGLRNVVWENVVGVLSTKDNAFGYFLAGLVGADSAIEPPRRGKWPSAGMVSGPKGRAAWRVLDAQYFGVAQRRRRVIVVADFGNGADPAAVLFEQDGMRRYSPPSREKGKGVARAVEGGAGGGGDRIAFALGSHAGAADGDQTNRSHASGGPVGSGISEELAYSLRAGRTQAVGYAPEIARCDATREGSSQDYETTTMVAVGVHGEVAHTLKAEGADASEDGTGRGTPVVCIHADSIGRTGEAVTPSADAAGVVRLRNPGMGIADDGTSYNLMASGQPHAVSVAIRGRDGGATAELGGDVAAALRASQGGGDKPHVLTSAVRRLTPRECERLQGFPDDYTAIPWRGKTADQCPDGPRYKALGNSWAVPKFAWLGRRIQALMPVTREAANDNTEETTIAAAA